MLLAVLPLAERGFHIKHKETYRMKFHPDSRVAVQSAAVVETVTRVGGSQASLLRLVPGSPTFDPPLFKRGATATEGSRRACTCFHWCEHVHHPHPCSCERVFVCVCAVTVCVAHIKSSRSHLAHPGNLPLQSPPSPPGKSTFSGRSTTGVCWTESCRKRFVLLLVWNVSLAG